MTSGMVKEFGRALQVLYSIVMYFMIVITRRLDVAHACQAVHFMIINTQGWLRNKVLGRE